MASLTRSANTSATPSTAVATRR